MDMNRNLEGDAEVCSSATRSSTRLGLERRTPAGDLFTGLGLFAVGVLVGAGLGLMFAPKRGDEMRQLVRGGAGEPRPRGPGLPARHRGRGRARRRRRRRVTEAMRRTPVRRYAPAPSGAGAPSDAADAMRAHSASVPVPSIAENGTASPLARPSACLDRAERRAAPGPRQLVHLRRRHEHAPPGAAQERGASRSLSAGGWRASTMSTTARSTSRPRR